MDVRISQLPEPKHLTPGDLIPLVSHGDNVAISLEHFLFEISHILDNVPCSALHIAKDAKVKALQAITKAQEAYTIAKNAYNASDEATQKVTEINEKTTTNANDIATLKVDKVTIQAQINNLEQVLNSTADDLRITVTTQVTPSATKYLFKRGETIVATVVVPDVDTSLTMAGSAADAKATGDAIQNVRDSIPTKVSEFANDANYLTEGNANQKYLSKTEAQSTYLTQRAAENTYLSKTDASVIYPSKVEVANDYLNKNDAADVYPSKTEAAQIYLSKNDAKTTYVSKTSAQQTYYDKTQTDEKFLSKENASAIYPSKNDVDTKYLNKNDAANIYLSQNDASNTYLNKVDAETTYLDKDTASDTYLTKANANDVYLNKANAQTNYLSKVDATDKYLSKTDASDTYLTKDLAVSTYASKADLASKYYTKTEIDNTRYTKTETDLLIDNSLKNYTVSADTLDKTYAKKAYVDNAIKQKIASVYEYQGQATYNNLPADAKTGDVWNVTDAHGDVPAGTNYAAVVATDGTLSWDPLAGDVTIENYDTTVNKTSKVIAKINGREITVKRDQIPVTQGAVNLNNESQVLVNVDGVDVKAKVVSDSTLSTDSENSVQNKVVTTKLNQLESTLTDTTETTHVLNDKYIALSKDVDTNKHNIVDLDNRLTTQEQKEVKVICNNATIGTTLTTIGSVNGVDIKARVAKQDVSVSSSDAEIGTSLTTIATVDGKEIKARVAPVNIVNKDATLSDNLTTIATINGVNINVKLPQGGVVVDSLDAGIGGDLTTVMVINGKEVKTKVNTDTKLSKTSSNPIANSTVATSIEDLTNKYNDLATKYTQLLNSFEEITGNTVSTYFNS